MRIGLDYTAALLQKAGIGRYTRGLVAALARLDQENAYTLLVPRNVTHALRPSGPADMTVHRLPLTEWSLTVTWHRLRLPLPIELFCGNLDVFHSPDFVLPPVLRARTIVTVHDLSFLRYPECADARLVAYLSAVVPRSLRRADLILADSAWTRRDLMEMLDVPASKITVVPAGVGNEYHPITEPAQLALVQHRYQLPQRFVLHVGTLEPRKNLVALIEAFALLAPKETDLHLLLVGAKGWLYREIYSAVERLGLSGRVVFPGYIREDHLPVLYNLASAFAFPSLYEGFGLPPLEALACGVPTVCSNSSSLPEVVGDAALSVEPSDVDGLAGALARLLHDDGLRADLRRRGLERARLFSWDAAARKLLSAYRQLCA